MSPTGWATGTRPRHPFLKISLFDIYFWIFVFLKIKMKKGICFVRTRPKFMRACGNMVAHQTLKDSTHHPMDQCTFLTSSISLSKKKEKNIPHFRFLCTVARTSRIYCARLLSCFINCDVVVFTNWSFCWCDVVTVRVTVDMFLRCGPWLVSVLSE